MLTSSQCKHRAKERTLRWKSEFNLIFVGISTIDLVFWQQYKEKTVE